MQEIVSPEPTLIKGQIYFLAHGVVDFILDIF